MRTAYKYIIHKRGENAESGTILNLIFNYRNVKWQQDTCLQKCPVLARKNTKGLPVPHVVVVCFATQVFF